MVRGNGKDAPLPRTMTIGRAVAGLMGVMQNERLQD